MARTPSNMLALGTQLPKFELFDTTSSERVKSSILTGNQGTVVMFICNHCPFVIHLHEGLQAIVEHYADKGVNFVAISSNDVDNYPQDGPDEMKMLFEELQLDIPYLYDESQEVAKTFEAACTPDFYLFGQSNELIYRGQFDDSRPGSGLPVTGVDLRIALDALISNSAQAENQKPSLGCNIKWKDS